MRYSPNRIACTITKNYKISINNDGISKSSSKMLNMQSLMKYDGLHLDHLMEY